jgi:acetyl-CoA acetyltransferase
VSVCIWGVGSSSFGRRPDKQAAELAWEAVAEALDDARVTEVDAAYVGTVFGAPGVAQRALSGVGITGIPIVTVENACASGTTAFHEARAAILAGRYERVLALGVEHLTSLFQGPIAPEPSDYEQASGMLLPAL